MANWSEPKEAEFREWLETRPNIRDVALRLPPWKLFRMKETGHRCYVLGYSEMADGNITVQVAVTGQFNLIKMGRRVFGISPDDLEECDLPGPNEPLGVTLTPDEQFHYVNKMRANNGVPPLTRDEYEELKRSDQPTCAVGDSVKST